MRHKPRGPLPPGGAGRCGAVAGGSGWAARAALMKVPNGRGADYRNRLGIQPGTGHARPRRADCECFAALFEASAGGNDGQTSCEVLRSATKALLLRFK